MNFVNLNRSKYFSFVIVFVCDFPPFATCWLERRLIFRIIASISRVNWENGRSWVSTRKFILFLTFFSIHRLYSKVSESEHWLFFVFFFPWRNNDKFHSCREFETSAYLSGHIPSSTTFVNKISMTITLRFDGMCKKKLRIIHHVLLLKPATVSPWL